MICKDHLLQAQECPTLISRKSGKGSRASAGVNKDLLAKRGESRENGLWRNKETLSACANWKAKAHLESDMEGMVSVTVTEKGKLGKEKGKME